MMISKFVFQCLQLQFLPNFARTYTGKGDALRAGYIFSHRPIISLEVEHSWSVELEASLGNEPITDHDKIMVAAFNTFNKNVSIF